MRRGSSYGRKAPKWSGFMLASSTHMAARVDAPKTSPRHVAERALEGLRSGLNHVVADDEAHDARAALLADPAAVEAKMQKAWEQGASPWSA